MKPHLFRRLCFGAWQKSACLTIKVLFTGNYIQSIKPLGVGSFTAGNSLPRRVMCLRLATWVCHEIKNTVLRIINYKITPANKNTWPLLKSQTACFEQHFFVLCDKPETWFFLRTRWTPMFGLESGEAGCQGKHTYSFSLSLLFLQVLIFLLNMILK